MKSLIASLLVFTTTAVYAAKNDIRFNYKDTPIVEVIEDYSKLSGQKFIIDPQVKGQITIINPERISVEDAFHQLSMALAANGLAISKQGNTMLVSQARMIQRNLIEVTTELPNLKPEKMHTWIINLKHANADQVNRQLRILSSRDGELVPYTATNQIIVTDWVSNLHRIASIIKELDRPSRMNRATASAHRPATPPPVAPSEGSETN